MPGNDLGDRVHNFFAQDNLSQGQYHSQVVEENWPAPNNFWVGSQGQVDQLSSNSRSYSSQYSDVDRGEAGFSLQVTNGLNLTQLNLRPDFAKNQSLNKQPNSNGFMYANQFHHTRQHEANFLGMDTGSENDHLISSRGLLAHEVLPLAGAGHQKAADRSEASVSPLSFDLFGGQQQMNHQQSSTTQSLLQQHSGINNIQQLQQQLMVRKLQEIQLQQQHSRQLDSGGQYFSSQVPSFPRHCSGGQSTLVNGTANSDTSLYPWTVAVGTNWGNHGSSSMQGSPIELGFPANLGQPQGPVDMVPQQVNQSLYGVPVSSSRGLNLNRYSPTSGASISQMPISSNFIQGNPSKLLPEQVDVRGEVPMSRHRDQNDNLFGHSSKQSQNLALGNMGGLQQTNSVSRNKPPKESSQEKPTREAALPRNEVALDPTEEKILFGSDDNIWATFAKVTEVAGESGAIFDNDGSNGLLSIQSGSWTALMQSAVAETSSSDIVPQEECGGVAFQKKEVPSWNQPPLFLHNNFKKETSLVDDSKSMPSALNSGSFPASDDASNNDMVPNQNRCKVQNRPGQRLQTEAPQMFFQSLGEADKWSNHGPLQNSIAEGSQHGDALDLLQAERNAKTIGFPGQTGATIRQNGWNTMQALRPEGNSNGHDTEKLQQKSKNSQVVGIQGGIFHGNASWKLNSVPNSTMEFCNAKSRVSNPQADQGILSLRSTGLVDNSCDLGTSDDINPEFQYNYSHNQQTNVHLSSRSQGREQLGRLLNQAHDPSEVLESLSGHEKDEVARFELENRDAKENSNDSHHSNLSQPAFGDFREGGLPEATISRPLSAGKQKLANQLSRKFSAPRKFQYHPMGNVSKDVEPAYGLKQPSHVQTMLQKNAQLGQSKLFGQVAQNFTLIEKGQSSELQRDIKVPEEETSRGDLYGHVPNRPVSHSQPDDTLSNASSSQNMLELFNKGDQSRNRSATMQLSSAEPSSLLPVMKKYDGFSRLQHSQSHVSHGFGLQLGPPSQGLPIPEHPLSSQNGQGTFISRANNAVTERGRKSPQLVAKHSIQSLPPSEGILREFKPNISSILEHGVNEKSVSKTPGNFTSLFSSGIPYSRNNDQNQQITRVSGQMSLSQLSENDSHSTRRTAEALLPDASGRFQQSNHTSFGASSQQCGQNDVQERVPTSTMETRDSQQTSHHAIPGHSQQGNSLEMLHKQNISAKIQKISSQIFEFPQPNIVESGAPLIHDHLNSQEEQRPRESTCQQVASLNTEAVPQVKNSSGKTSFLNNHLDDYPSSTLMQKDIEAFGRSLKPSNFSPQNYSLLNQMQASKDQEIDPSNRVLKRMKGLESVADGHDAASKVGQQHEQNDVDSLGSCRPVGLLPRNSQDGNAATRVDLELNRDTSCVNVMPSPRVDHPQISPQMAPSWFSQYECVKNGQMQQPYDALKVTPSRPGEQSLTYVQCSSGFHTVSSEEKRTTVPVDACQDSNNHQNLIASSIAIGDVSSLHSLQLNATGQNLGILRPTKRKSPALDLCPWHKEISDVSQDHVSHRCMTESGWHKATNCLIDKVNDAAELIEDGYPGIRHRRRLTLATYLMQKLLHSPPAAFISANASTRHESMVYGVSRIYLGDACSTLHHLSSLDVAPDGTDQHPPKGKLAVRNGVRCHAKGAEELVGRIGKLENDFLRLDKSTSVLDLRLECQDLEKYSVINRFARFHGRGQNEYPEISSANATATCQRPTPQRYVTALPLPRNIPDGVQCLPL